MRRRKIKHVSEYQDRHGKWWAKYRRKGFGTYTFQAAVGSHDFWQEHLLCTTMPNADAVKDAVANGDVPRRPQIEDTAPTMRKLADTYYTTSEFQALKPATQKDYRSVIEMFMDDYAESKVKAWKPALIKQVLDSKAATPTRANKLKKRLTTLFNLAIFMEWRDTSPMVGVKKIKEPKGGYHTWTDDEIKTFEDKHPSGSKARLALYLLLCTGVRRSDVVKLGRQHMRAGKIKVRAQKNSNWVHIPVHQKLQKEIDLLPSDQMQFILNEYGKPFTPAGFGNRMRKWCDDAGLSDCSSHGLRKAISRKLAEAGATSIEIGAVIGDTDLKAIEVYVRDANNEQLAANSIAKLKD